MSQIGLRAKGIRLRRGETQETVARRAGITLATYIRVETKRNEPTVDTLAKIAGALEVSVGDLLGEEVVS
jgi:transcriptional regulator with XRE-family HTH domain